MDTNFSALHFLYFIPTYLSRKENPIKNMIMILVVLNDRKRCKRVFKMQDFNNQTH